MYRFRASMSLLAFSIAHGQTMVDLRTQSKGVDFSFANATKPFNSGTVFPSICSVGEIFYKSDATAGANVFGCTATNAWTLEGQGLPAVSGNAGRVDASFDSTYFSTIVAIGGFGKYFACQLRSASQNTFDHMAWYDATKQDYREGVGTVTNQKQNLIYRRLFTTICQMLRKKALTFIQNCVSLHQQEGFAQDTSYSNGATDESMNFLRSRSAFTTA